MARQENTELFENTPVLRAVVALEVPTVISQLITVVYNMADTFFIGRTGDPRQVAAASLCLPLFMLLTGMANLFGIGGASLVTRSLGRGDRGSAAKASAFSLWGAGSAALVYGLLVWALRGVLFPLVGADGQTYEYCCRYALWVITAGAVPTVLSAALAHLVRAEGYSRQAGFGVGMGGVLNMILDPLFISVLHLEIAGAAIATLLSNLAAAAYFLLLIRRRRGALALSLRPRDVTLKRGIPREVLLVGLPSAVMNLSGVLSNVFMNRLAASYCAEAVAGLGIAKKVDVLNYAVATGMSQGVLPLIGYNWGAKNYRRMTEAVRTAFVLSFAVTALGTAFLLTGAGPVVRAFINDAQTVRYGIRFQRTICVTGVCVSASMVVITVFQAVGKKVLPLVLSVLRKGAVDIPAMFLLNRLAGAGGIAWATPVADAVSVTAALACFLPFWRQLRRELPEAPGPGPQGHPPDAG